MRVLATAIVLLLATPAGAHPEFEAWIEQRSGAWVDCAMCHTHPEGPEGVKPGQIRSLGPDELDALNRARSAFEPGAGVDSPILNDFGDRMLDELGKTEILRLRHEDPGQVAEALGAEGDLDGDGIADAREYLDGTHPLDAHSGEPLALARQRLRDRTFDLLMIVLATLAGVWGLNRLISSRRAGPGGGAATPRDAAQTSSREGRSAR